MYQYLILGIVFGVLIVLLASNPVRKVSRKFKQRAPLMKKYWIFVIPFVFLNAVAYMVVWRYFYDDTNFMVLGQISALLFAVFVGYIAFNEFGESKFDKLEESSSQALNRGEFLLAIDRYEEAYAIKPTENAVLGNLLELYLIMGKYDKFDDNLPTYQKNTVEKSEILVSKYLLTLKALIREHMQEARELIAESINFVTENPKARETFHWRNDELKSSDSFGVMSESAQTMALNYFAYLKRQLSTDEEAMFVSGEYEKLDEVPVGKSKK